ncbi:MAG: universal stress protein [Planctomycetaceae bacterium]
MTTRILVPTDFSPYAAAAADYAVSLAAHSNAELLIAHVKPSAVLPHSEEDVADPLEPELHTKLSAVARNSVGVAVSRRFLRGNPVDELLKLAKETGVRQIVMGTHGQTMAPEKAIGSIAEAVLLRATCRVILVKGETPA